MELFTRAWWKATGARLLYTAAVGVLPLVAQLAAGTVTPAYAGGYLGVVILVTFATALFRLPEVAGAHVPRWKAILTRLARTIGQYVAAGLAPYVLIQEVDWRALGVTVGVAAVSTLIRALAATLPEAAKTPLDPVPDPGSGGVDLPPFTE